MSRASFVFKSKEDLRQMPLEEIDAYIRTLQLRLMVLSGPPHKSTRKQLEVASRVRDSVAPAIDDADSA